MTNMSTAIITNGNASASPAVALGGWSLKDVLEMTADAVIDQYRFQSDVDRVLARYEDDVPALMPSCDELSAMGIDVVALARALQAGLDARLFGSVLDLGSLDIASFNKELAAGLDIAAYNEGMEHVVDLVAERIAHPDFVDRVLSRHGDC